MMKYECDKPNCAFCLAEKRGTYRIDGWTKSDLFILESNYKQVNIEKLEIILNRSRRAIWSKAKRIKEVNGIVK